MNMDIVNVIFNAIFLIVGILLIIGYTSLAIYYKKKYPEKEWKYKYAPLFYVFGVLLIIGVITDYIRVMIPLIIVISGFYILYAGKKHLEAEKKHPEMYKFLNFQTKISLIFIMFILIISLLAFLYIN